MNLLVALLRPLERTLGQLALLVRHQVPALAEGHPLQVYCRLRLNCRARGERSRLRYRLHLGLLVHVHRVRARLGLSVPGELPQNPPNAFLTHRYLHVDTLVRVAPHQLCTPHDDIAVLNELADEREVFVLEKVHELVFAVAYA